MHVCIHRILIVIFCPAFCLSHRIGRMKYQLKINGYSQRHFCYNLKLPPPFFTFCILTTICYSHVVFTWNLFLDFLKLTYRTLVLLSIAINSQKRFLILTVAFLSKLTEVALIVRCRYAIFFFFFCREKF